MIDEYGESLSIKLLNKKYEFDSFVEYKKDQIDVMFVYHSNGKVIKAIQVNNLGKNCQTLCYV